MCHNQSSCSCARCRPTVDESVNHRQAQPCSLATRLGAEERLEGPLQGLAGHAVAGIGDGNANIQARFDVPCLHRRIAFLQGAQSCRDGQGTAVGHCVPGVDREIEKRAFQSRGIDIHGWHRGVEARKDLDLRAQRSLHQFDHVPDRVFKIHVRGVQFLPAGEGQQRRVRSAPRVAAFCASARA